LTARQVANTPASVRQRLLNKARASNRPFNELLQHYAMERFLYRLSESEHGDRFVLKGALLLRVWEAPFVRPTMNIDMLGRTNNAPDALVAIVRAICQQVVEDDGLQFDDDSVSGAAITEDADYAGVRLRFHGKLGTARVRMQVDVGFGDVITPEPSLVDYPTLLSFPAPRLLAYPRETVVAEKFQVMLHRDMLNSRLRDYYDIWLLSRSFTFDGARLAEAIRKTCMNRDTPVLERPVGLSISRRKSRGERSGGLSCEKASSRERLTIWRPWLRRSESSSAQSRKRSAKTAISNSSGIHLGHGSPNRRRPLFDSRRTTQGKGRS